MENSWIKWKGWNIRESLPYISTPQGSKCLNRRINVYSEVLVEWVGNGLKPCHAASWGFGRIP